MVVNCRWTFCRIRYQIYFNVKSNEFKKIENSKKTNNFVLYCWNVDMNEEKFLKIKIKEIENFKNSKNRSLKIWKIKKKWWLCILCYNDIYNVSLKKIENKKLKNKETEKLKNKKRNKNNIN